MEEVVNIDVLGEKFTFKADLDDQSAREAINVFQKELEKIDKKVKEGTQSAPKLVKLLLAIMNIADKLIKIQIDSEVLDKNISYRLNELSEKL